MSSRLTFTGSVTRLKSLTNNVLFSFAAVMLISATCLSAADAESVALNGGGSESDSSARTVTFGSTSSSVVSETKTPVVETHAEAKEAASESKGKTLVLKGGTTDSSSYEDALAIEAPQPELPAEHNEQGIKTSCCARFTIDEMGKFSVRLVSSTGSQEVDDLALATLRRWKFKPAQLNGKAVKSSRKIKIEFEIE